MRPQKAQKVTKTKKKVTVKPLYIITGTNWVLELIGTWFGLGIGGFGTKKLEFCDWAGA